MRSYVLSCQCRWHVCCNWSLFPLSLIYSTVQSSSLSSFGLRRSVRKLFLLRNEKMFAPHWFFRRDFFYFAGLWETKFDSVMSFSKRLHDLWFIDDKAIGGPVGMPIQWLVNLSWRSWSDTWKVSWHSIISFFLFPLQWDTNPHGETVGTIALTINSKIDLSPYL